MKKPRDFYLNEIKKGNIQQWMDIDHNYRWWYTLLANSNFLRLSHFGMTVFSAVFPTYFHLLPQQLLVTPKLLSTLYNIPCAYYLIIGGPSNSLLLSLNLYGEEESIFLTLTGNNILHLCKSYEPN